MFATSNSSGVHEHDALHMRRLADVVIASILLAITATSKASG
jgi:hypothetical protein